MLTHAYLTIVFLFSGLILYALPLAHVDPSIWTTLQSKTSTDILIAFKPTNDDIISQYAKNVKSRKAQSLNELNKELKDRTKKAQSQVTQYVDQQRSSRSNHPAPISLWLPNVLIIKEADAEWIKKISTFEEVSEIIQDKKFPRMKPVKYAGTRQEPSPPRLWNLDTSHVRDVWEAGTRGKGVVIGLVDSGVKVTHEALKNSFRTSYGWYDPIAKTSGPMDHLGHGTGVLGVIVGKSPQETFGVAPDAQWIACKGSLDDLNDTVALTSVVQCMNWMWCPTDTQGKNENCDMAPKVVNCSWFFVELINFLETILKALSVRGIPIIFAAGNRGPNCSTVYYPPESQYVIAVGSVDASGLLVLGSSRGPGEVEKRIKPDVVAPGERIFTADISSDTEYKITGGTSFAAPFVSGLAALFFSAYPKATLNQFKESLIRGVVPVSTTGDICGGLDQKTSPNNHFGYGRVDAQQFMSVAMAVAGGTSGNHHGFYKLFLCLPLIPILLQ